MSDERTLRGEQEDEAEDGAYIAKSAPGEEATDQAFRRARRETWLTRITVVAVIAVLALWAVRGEAVSPALVRYASGIALSAIALSLAVLLAMRAGHYRLLAERAYLIQLHQATKGTRQQVLRDHLSGLYRRRFFHERLTEELARCSRYGRVSSVAYLWFPAWNTLSLAIQGELIERVGYLLQNDLRASDVAARWGPGRFIWYLPETDASQAMVTAQRLADALETTDAVVATAQYPVDGSSPEELLQAVETRTEAARAA